MEKRRKLCLSWKACPERSEIALLRISETVELGKVDPIDFFKKYLDSSI
jgi:hypothetical protein